MVGLWYGVIYVERPIRLMQSLTDDAQIQSTEKDFEMWLKVLEETIKWPLNYYKFFFLTSNF